MSVAAKAALPQKLALLIPLLIFAAWTANLEFAVRFAERVRLRVIGYDPRDLLSGRYLQYQVDYGKSVCPADDNPNYCACLEPGSAEPAVSDPPAQAGWTGICSERPSGCRTFVRGACFNGRFYTNLDRFYMPEWFAPYVVTLPPDSSIEASVTSSGYATVREYYAGTKTLAEYVEALRAKQHENSPPVSAGQ